MSDQIKYSARYGLELRLFTFLAVIVLNVAFAFLGYNNIYGTGGKITAIVLSSLAATGVCVVCLIADIQSVRGIFSAPTGYNMGLVPVAGWKILLGRIIPMVAFDLVSIAAAASGVVIQTFIHTRLSLQAVGAVIDSGYLLWSGAAVFLEYLSFLNLIFLTLAISKSVLFRFRGRGFLTFLAFLLIAYAHTLSYLVLGLVAPLSYYGYGLFTISIYAGLNVGMVSYLLLTLLTSGVMFLLTARMIERRLNL